MTRLLPLADLPVDLDKHRGMAAQKATDLRRLLAEVQTNTETLRARQAELEEQLLALPAASWPEAAAKARYLLQHYQDSLGQQDTQHRRLVTAVMADFSRLLADD